MKKNSLWVVIALMITATMTGCSTNGVEEDLPEPEVCPVDSVDPTDPTVITDPIDPPVYVFLSPTEKQLVNGSNDFAFNLFRVSHDEKYSQILSPISITYALGMLNNGAVGETQAQIDKVLGFGDTGADGINEFCQKMLTMASTWDEKTKVLIANTIFMNKPYELFSEFVSKAKRFYDAEPETRDFHDGKTLDVINQWASDHTEKMIEKVLSEGEFNPDAVSYLLNAIYFKGSWMYKFDKEDTKDEIFNHIGSTKELTYAPIMHQNDAFLYTENEFCQAVSLPYGNGAYQMTILLPTGEDIDKVLASLTDKSWKQMLGQMVYANVDLKLPRFETDTDINLVPVMKKLGMTDAFIGGLADFSNFCNSPTFIGLMKQVAKIKLDEEGTEAAAVTVIGVDVASEGPEPERKNVTFHATRPFLYVISERLTGAIFFIGQYTGYNK